jgi:excisionase family DNA binding protein
VSSALDLEHAPDEARSDETVTGLELLDSRATITVEEAAELLGIGRSAAYEAARSGDLPVRRIGRRILVPVPALRVWLGLPTQPAQDGGSYGVKWTS